MPLPQIRSGNQKGHQSKVSPKPQRGWSPNQTGDSTTSGIRVSNTLTPQDSQVPDHCHKRLWRIEIYSIYLFFLTKVKEVKFEIWAELPQGETALLERHNVIFMYVFLFYYLIYLSPGPLSFFARSVVVLRICIA